MAGSLAGFEVRAATGRDGPRMAELDRLAFGAAGMGHYGESHVRCWLEVNPEGLLVASRDGTAVACCYSQYVDFSPEAVSLLTTDAAFTDSALTRKTHRPNGNAIHVVTVSSIVPGGRKALFETLMRQLVAQQREFLILFSRVCGLRDYCRTLTEKGFDVDSLGLERIARWYVAQCALQFGGAGLWPDSLLLNAPTRSRSDSPAVTLGGYPGGRYSPHLTPFRVHPFLAMPGIELMSIDEISNEIKRRRTFAIISHPGDLHSLYPALLAAQ